MDVSDVVMSLLLAQLFASDFVIFLVLFEV